jgi:hypothetical protein
MGYEPNVQRLTRLGRDLHQIFLVLLREQDRAQLETVSSQHLLTNAADRQHFAAQRDLARQSDVMSHGPSGERRGQSRRHRDPGARAVLRDGAFGDVDMDVGLLETLALTPSRGST